MGEENEFQPLKTSILMVVFYENKFDVNADDTSDDELYNHFQSNYPDGQIVSCEVGDGNLPNIAYVNYINHEQATIAINLLNATVLKNKPIKVMFSPQHQSNSGSIIHIKNFDRSIDKDYWQKILSPYGNILVIKFPTDDNAADATLLVQYDSNESAQTAMNALHGKRIMNKKLYIRTAEKPRPSDDENGDSIFMVISSDLSEVYLLKTFSPFGVVTTVRVYDDYKGGLCGTVVFKNPAAAAKAAEALTNRFHPDLLMIRRLWNRTHWQRFLDELAEEEASGSAAQEAQAAQAQAQFPLYPIALTSPGGLLPKYPLSFPMYPPVWGYPLPDPIYGQQMLYQQALPTLFPLQNENAWSWSMKMSPPLPQPPPVEPTFTCPVCMGPYVEEMSTKCGHIFCKKCIRASIAVRGQCPTCRGKISMKNTIRVYLPAAK